MSVGDDRRGKNAAPGGAPSSGGRPSSCSLRGPIPAVALALLLALTACSSLELSSSDRGAGTTGVSPAGIRTLSGSTGGISLQVWSATSVLSEYTLGVAVDGTTNPDSSYSLALLNASGFHYLRYGAAWTDETNATNNCFYETPTVGACNSPQNIVGGFAKACVLLRDNCTLALPAEINKVSVATYEMNWLKSTYNWWPTCWAIGDEPSQWKHFNIPWTSWTSGDAATPTPTQFALLVSNYTGAIRHIDPGACIIGDESADAWPGANRTVITTYYDAVVSKVHNLSALAFHIESAGKGTAGTLSVSGFLQPRNLSGITTVYNTWATPNASGLPVFIDEEAPCRSDLCVYNWTYSNAVYAAAMTAQIVDVGAPHAAYFRLNSSGQGSLWDSATNSGSPTYYLEALLQAHLDTGDVLKTTVSGGSPEVYAATTSSNSTDRTTLIANANASLPLNVTLSSFVPSGWRYQTYYQDWSTGITTSQVGTTADVTEMGNQSTLLVHYWNPTGASSASSPGSGTTNSTPPPAGDVGGGFLQLPVAYEVSGIAAAGLLLLGVVVATSHRPRRRPR